ncbi:hypothetical protein HFP70_35430 [Streptomyces sp. ARC14]|uniref:hypothetical protein n=1 Tax=Streptomyces sp. ARC14 TaxID=2724152 RepID=UPI0038579026
MPAEFMFRAFLPVMVTITADDYDTARQAYADIDGATYSPQFDTGDGPVLAYVAIDDSNPVLSQINRAEPVLCETCECDDLTGYVVNGECINPECPDKCTSDGCQESVIGDGVDGRCGSCTNLREQHERNDKKARKRHRKTGVWCPVCPDES